ncbi:hypothetical protein CASFOL_029073 [Castilleja foliolosa]|uniref:RING-type domain-containing protein n=1 Tax=Castilleja foliolosa TaxID=1961234 RepID=A0ABD3CCV7_9LAMI
MDMNSGYQHYYHSSMASSYDGSIDFEFQTTVFVFEIRTNFLLVKRTLDHDEDYEEQIMGSENLSATLRVPADQLDDWLERLHGDDFSHITYRLKEYLMPGDEIQSLIHEVFDFAQEIMAVDPSIPVVPIVVDVGVCTVQLDGETLDHAIDRSVRPDCLIPLPLLRPEWKKNDSFRPINDYLLYGLPRIGVEDEGFGAHMETCSICLGGPTAAAPMSLLPCNHAFHRHCVVKWMLKSWTCPLCRHEIAHDILKEAMKGTNKDITFLL